MGCFCGGSTPPGLLYTTIRRESSPLPHRVKGSASWRSDVSPAGDFVPARDAFGPRFRWDLLTAWAPPCGRIGGIVPFVARRSGGASTQRRRTW